MEHRKDCIFCRIVAGKAAAYVIDETEQVIVFLSLENHPLVVPKAHIPDIYAMPAEVGARVMEETIRVKAALGCDGVYLTQSNGRAAGQDVFHFHLHVYPCWQGVENRAIGRFFRTVTDRKHVTAEMKAATMGEIRAALAHHKC
jgi:histidine triad (HIT) family protein